MGTSWPRRCPGVVSAFAVSTSSRHVVGGRRPAFAKTSPLQYMSGVDKVVPSVGAYVLYTDNASTLVYALDALQAMEFFINTMGNWMTASQMYSISVDRMSSMDQYGTGRTPRVEMNPRVMESASLARSNSGRQHKIVNIVEFSNILKVSK